jgi:hypothetical protein
MLLTPARRSAPSQEVRKPTGAGSGGLSRHQSSLSDDFGPERGGSGQSAERWPFWWQL